MITISKRVCILAFNVNPLEGYENIFIKVCKNMGSSRTKDMHCVCFNYLRLDRFLLMTRDI